MGGKTTTGQAKWTDAKDDRWKETPNESAKAEKNSPQKETIGYDIGRGIGAITPGSLRKRATQGLDFEEYPEKKKK
jgi:hypothetical protein